RAWTCRSSRALLFRQDVAPTPLAQLTVAAADECPADVRSGTKDAFLRGFRHLGYLVEDRPGATVTAVSAWGHALAADQCFIVAGGRVLWGKAAVWRYPCHSPEDMCVLQAEKPPPRAPLHANSIMLSPKGRGNSGMAGGACDLLSWRGASLLAGDMDGDNDEVSFHPLLVEFLELTQPDVDAVPWEDYKTSVLAGLEQGQTEWVGVKSREQYLAHAVKLNMANLRGEVAALSERVTGVALASPTPENIDYALKFAVLAHN
ncbi:unnamed protein product, partial [Effrenium voratum]